MITSAHNHIRIVSEGNSFGVRLISLPSRKCPNKMSRVYLVDVESVPDVVDNA
jgi:hypothetical protein